MLKPLTVIVPIAAGDEEWRGLLPLLVPIGVIEEIILSASQAMSEAERATLVEFCRSDERIRLLEGPQGRALQINRALQQARTQWIWVLHADSRFAGDLIPHLQNLREGALHYFDLAFRSPAPQLLQLNVWAVRWRSDRLGMPFGDQGFLFERQRARELGFFPEGPVYGEDHLFVWRWRQRGWPLQRIAARLATSARKYQRRGWASTTAVHVFLTYKQAWPEFLTYLRTLRLGLGAKPPFKSKHRR